MASDMWLYAFVPVAVCLLGGLYAVLRPPGPGLTAAVQHLAAGVVFAAAAAELLPDALGRGELWPLVGGAVAGVVAMLALERASEAAKGPLGLVGASAVDALVDGLVLGLAVQAGPRQGLLLAIALAVEFAFLAVSVGASVGRGASRLRVLGATAGIGLMVPLGVLVSLPVAHAPAALQTAAYAFGLIALLYLVTEELLVEAHERPHASWVTALFFLGFVGLIVLDELLGAG